MVGVALRRWPPRQAPRLIAVFMLGASMVQALRVDPPEHRWKLDEPPGSTTFQDSGVKSNLHGHLQDQYQFLMKTSMKLLSQGLEMNLATLHSVT